MNQKRLRLSTLALALGMGLGATRLPAQQLGMVQDNVFVPDSSIERPGDIGLRSHTNHLIMIYRAGGLGVGGGMSPAQLRAIYGLPSTGGHDVIAIVDAFDFPAAQADFNVFSSHYGLPTETSTNRLSATNKVFQVVYQGGRKPQANTGWSQEEALDIEWAHAMAPNAKIVLVEAQSNSFTNLYASVDQAAAIAGVTQVSMSWGGSEFSGESIYDSHFNIGSTQKPGPVFFASSGDTGGKTIYPSTSQYVVAAGGTSVATNSSGAFVSESGWSGGGGGNSPYEIKPSWQSGIGGSGRSVPDIASDANPNTGVSVYGPVNNARSGWLIFGGTSVSAPCLAGMVNLSGKAYNNTTALLQTIYANYHASASSYFRDITSGNNGFPCLPGWDFVTGVGSPLGTAGF